jgi:hypothetical protein
MSGHLAFSARAHSSVPDGNGGPPVEVSPRTMTLFLAYTHHYTPALLPGGRLSPRHLRRLADWIGQPRPGLRSVRQHRALAAHYALGIAGGLLNHQGRQLALDRQATLFLHTEPGLQIGCLIRLLQAETWPRLLEQLGLHEAMAIDYITYLQQSLQRLLLTAQGRPAPGLRLENGEPERWTLLLDPELPSWLLFDLLQLGAWHPGHPLALTPSSLAGAVHRGYGLNMIVWLLETATGQELDQAHRQQLSDWLRRSEAFSLDSVLLLRAARPEHLDRLLGRRRLRARVIEQLSSRHVTVAAALLPELKRWLRGQGLELNGNHETAAGLELQAAPPAGEATCWLGLRLLISLGELMPLPYPAPHAQLASLGERIPAAQAHELEALAQQVLGSLRELIRGRDAFFPAVRPPAPGLRQRVEQAIADQEPLAFTYLSPADHEPRYRRVQPLRLEARGSLCYLHAYCYRAEKNLTFRLDRIHELHD